MLRRVKHHFLANDNPSSICGTGLLEDTGAVGTGHSSVREQGEAADDGPWGPVGRLNGRCGLFLLQIQANKHLVFVDHAADKLAKRLRQLLDEGRNRDNLVPFS